jgi:aryl carrier-like protein
VVLADPAGPTDTATTPAAGALATEVEHDGGRLTVVGGDCADPAALLAAAARAGGGPVTAVLHAGGGDPGAPDGGTAVAALDTATAGLDLAAFVAFTPLPAQFGDQGADDGAVRAVLAGRRAAGRAALQVSWGPHTPAMAASHAGRGVAAVLPGVAMAVLTEAGRNPHAVVADIDWPRYLGARPDPFFHGLPDVARTLALTGAAAGTAAALRAQLAAADPEEAAAIVLEVLRSHAAAVLGHASADALDTEVTLLELGFSSFTALELSGRLRAATGLEVPAAVVFDHPTLTALARHLSAELRPASSTGPAPNTQPATAGTGQETR